MPQGLFGSTTIDCYACMEQANTRGTDGTTGVVAAFGPVSKMAADITDGRALGGTSVSFDHLANACSPALTWWIE